jgi:hypothetical protein
MQRDSTCRFRDLVNCGERTVRERAQGRCQLPRVLRVQMARVDVHHRIAHDDRAVAGGANSSVRSVGCPPAAVGVNRCVRADPAGGPTPAYPE